MSRSVKEVFDLALHLTNCDCADKRCPHKTIRQLADNATERIAKILSADITTAECCTCDTQPDICAHKDVREIAQRLILLAIEARKAKVTPFSNIKEVKEDVYLRASPRESLHCLLDQQAVGKNRQVRTPTPQETDSPVVSVADIEARELLATDLPASRPITPVHESERLHRSSIPVSVPHRPKHLLITMPKTTADEPSPKPGTSHQAQEQRMHSTPRDSSYQFDFTTTRAAIPHSEGGYGNWSYNVALAAVDEYVSLPSLLSVVRQLRKFVFHIKAQRDEAVSVLNNIPTVSPFSPTQRFPSGQVLVNISTGVIADLLTKLRSCLDLGERFVANSSNDSNRLGSHDDAKLSYHKVLQRLQEIPRTAPPDHLAVYGIFTVFSFETYYELEWRD